MRSRLNVGGTVPLPFHITASPLIFANSGSPYSITTGVTPTRPRWRDQRSAGASATTACSTAGWEAPSTPARARPRLPTQRRFQSTSARARPTYRSTCGCPGPGASDLRLKLAASRPRLGLAARGGAVVVALAVASAAAVAAVPMAVAVAAAAVAGWWRRRLRSWRWWRRWSRLQHRPEVQPDHRCAGAEPVQPDSIWHARGHTDQCQLRPDDFTSGRGVQLQHRSPAHHTAGQLQLLTSRQGNRERGQQSGRALSCVRRRISTEERSGYRRFVRLYEPGSQDRVDLRPGLATAYSCPVLGWSAARGSARRTVFALRNSRMPAAESSRP